MEERVFLNKSVKPTDRTIRSALAKAFPFYDELMKITGAFSKEWNYSKSSGWIQKISDSKKALFYVIPLKGSFKISLTVRENEKDKLLSCQDLLDVYEQLETAKKYVEGYAMQFILKDKESYQKYLGLIKRIMEMRK